MKHKVTVTREGKWWVAVVDGVLGGATEAQRLSVLEVEVRDLLAGLLDVDDDSFDLKWDLTAVLGPDGQAMWEAYQAEREELDRRRRKFEEDRRATVRKMADAGISVRDTGTLVELSHQRVAQLLDV